MRRSAEEVDRLIENFRATLRRASVKVTSKRLAVFREAAVSLDHPDIMTIFGNVRRKIPSVSLDTVYRALDLFRELGLVNALRPLDARARFDADIAPHHHFVCVGCGLTRDLHDLNAEGLEIPESAKALGRVESAHVAFRGLCTECLKSGISITHKGG